MPRQQAGTTMQFRNPYAFLPPGRGVTAKVLDPAASTMDVDLTVPLQSISGPSLV